MAEVTERDYPADIPGPEYKMELVWRNIIIFLFLHVGAIYGYFTPKQSWWTIVFSKYLSPYSFAIRSRSIKMTRFFVLSFRNARKYISEYKIATLPI